MELILGPLVSLPLLALLPTHSHSAHPMLARLAAVQAPLSILVRWVYGLYMASADGQRRFGASRQAIGTHVQ